MIAEKTRKALLELFEKDLLPRSRFSKTDLNDMIARGFVISRKEGRGYRVVKGSNWSKEKIEKYYYHQNGKELSLDIGSLVNRREAAIAVGNSKATAKSKSVMPGFYVRPLVPESVRIDGETAHDGLIYYIDTKIHVLEIYGQTVMGIENYFNFIHQKKDDLPCGIVALFFMEKARKQCTDYLASSGIIYYHFGDFDYEGLDIYLSRKKKIPQSRIWFPSNYLSIAKSFHANKRRMDEKNKHTHSLGRSGIDRLLNDPDVCEYAKTISRYVGFEQEVWGK